MEHKCKELDLANADEETNCEFTIKYTLWHVSGLYTDMPESVGKCNWKLINNEDEHYSPPYINYCPYCGEKLGKNNKGG